MALGGLLGLQAPSLCWVFPGELDGQRCFPPPSHCGQPFCFPNALCLGTLPQNMQYVWVTCPTPTPPPRAAPRTPKAAAATASL